MEIAAAEVIAKALNGVAGAIIFAGFAIMIGQPSSTSMSGLEYKVGQLTQAIREIGNKRR